MVLAAETATPFGLVIHELATNAVKYGALSGSDGVVNLTWSLDSRGPRRTLRLEWRESGGPSVGTLGPAGFGSFLIESGLPRRRGRARFQARRARLQSCLVAAARERRGQPFGETVSAVTQDVLEGAHILLVEDEAMIALDLKTTLEEAGARVIGPAATLEQARALLARSDAAVTAAVLDVRLGLENVYPVADALAARAVPLVFHTGNIMEPEIARKFPKAAVVSKPASVDRLMAELRSVLAKEAAAGGNKRTSSTMVSSTALSWVPGLRRGFAALGRR